MSTETRAFSKFSFFDTLENSLEILQAQAFPKDRENPAFDLLLYITTAKKMYLENDRTEIIYYRN